MSRNDRLLLLSKIMTTMLLVILFCSFVYFLATTYDKKNDLLQLIPQLEDVPNVNVEYQVSDDRGFHMDGLKVIADPYGGYLGVYHMFTKGHFNVRLAFSHDLM